MVVAAIKNLLPLSRNHFISIFPRRTVRKQLFHCLLVRKNLFCLEIFMISVGCRVCFECDKFGFPHTT